MEGQDKEQGRSGLGQQDGGKVGHSRGLEWAEGPALALVTC